ncbi:MAG TPA: PASTA domain-containing protein, partial [Candidatus Nitrosotenuis sp.]|nr:PASTA domain-containing protein [Candidatus Nitrosotenuis sp.]
RLRPAVTAAAAPPPPARGPSHGWVWAALGAVLASLLAVFLWLVTGPMRSVEVPDLRGHTVDQARQLVADLDLELEVAAQKVNPAVPPGTILGQNPAPGQRVKRHSRVYLEVSRGPALVKVPDLVGMTRSQAVSELDRLGLRPALRESADPQVQVGLVTGQDPPAGTEVDPGSSVQVVVSSGTGRTPVPQLVGLKRAEAEKVLAGLGLLLEVQESRPDAR